MTICRGFCQPQHALPDVFLWMVSGNKRIAYQRLQAKDILYSIVEEECGKLCGKVQTILLRVGLTQVMSMCGAEEDPKFLHCTPCLFLLLLNTPGGGKVSFLLFQNGIRK